MKILASRRFPGRAWDELEDVDYSDLLDGSRPDVEALAVVGEEIDARTLDLFPRLRLVANYGVGYDGIDVRACVRRGVAVTNTPHALGVATADLTMALILAVRRRVVEGDRFVRDGKWGTEWVSGVLMGDEVGGATLGLVGLGRIGREVARIARAFRMRVAALARDCSPGRAESLGVDQVYSREELHLMLAEADCLVVCAPLTPETEDLLGAAEFAALKQGAVFVNIGRGAIIDEHALLQGLSEGRIAFAALDVFREEPLPPDSPFWDMPNVLINPHSASTVATENAKIAELFVRNLGHYLAGEVDQMSPLLDKHRLY